ncbi:DUF1294 domain-containing protein [Halomonas alkalicola]|uniref:DUF1294 domain-containing protein n=1 Tax=Halomonas alkalicola TaxID=1930622 RepID=A0ABY9H638_9GAMM|nr:MULTISPECIES: DUF1294 domain-containing protein [Halomonas]AXY42651.1 DUF1294 domain-containing protein [Halomonas sp. JS92-SW72]WLI73966.1 DUF1294 domain-containing protein [Halomonas alkalicola]
MTWLIGLYLPASLAAAALYGIDKAAARCDRRRVPESTLHLVALAGGWPGALLARRAFRHKTRKQPFGAILWGCVALNVGLVAWLATAEATLGLRRLAGLE